MIVKMKIQFSSTIPVDASIELEAELSELVSWDADPTAYKLVCLTEVNTNANGFDYEALLEKK
jgi:hypothetical protein